MVEAIIAGNIRWNRVRSFSLSWDIISTDADMIFVKKFTQPDFKAKNLTPIKCVICYLL